MDKEEGVKTIDVDAAKKMLIDAGYNVLDSKALEKRLEKERNKSKTHIEELEELRGEHEKVLARLKEFDDAEKTELQKWQDRKKEWEKREKEAKDLLAKAQADADTAKAETRAILRDVKLDELTKGAADARLARLAALDKFPNMTTNENGELVLTDKAGVETVGEDAVKAVSDWWNGMEILHSAPPSGPSTKGGTPSPKIMSTEIDPNLPLDERLTLADRLNKVPI